MNPIDRNKLVSELTAEELATLIRASIPPPAERPKRLPGTCALGAIGVAGLGGVK